jgi:alpha-2-macroglobulin
MWTSVVTDATGRGSVSFKLPHNLTRWRIEARAITADADIGEAQTTVTASLLVSMHPAIPRFAVVGDHLALSGVIRNDTPNEIEVHVDLEADGFTLDDPRSGKYITMAPYSRQRYEWWGTVDDTDAISLTMSAYYNNTADRARPAPIPVLHYVAPDYVGTSGVLNEGGKRTEGISLPPSDNATGLLTVQINSSLASTVLDALPTFDEASSANMEVVASSLYASSAAYRILKEAGHLTPEQEAQLSTRIKTAIQLLYDGKIYYLWGWWRGGAYNYNVTAHILLALHEAQQAGFALRDDIVKPVLQEMSYPVNAIDDSSASRLNEQALYLYVKYLYSAPDTDLAEFEDNKAYDDGLLTIDELFARRDRLSDAGRAYLLLAYHESRPDAEEVTTLINDLTTRAALSASGTHWQTEASDRSLWGSDTRTTALVLSALLQTSPDELSLPNAVRWLVSMRRGTGWRTTQDTALTTLALLDWIQATDELNGQYDYTLSLNDLTLLSGAVSAEAPSSKTAYIDITALSADTINQLTATRSAGKGALYYTANLQLQLPASEVTAQTRGITVERMYFMGGTQDPVISATIGDILNVRLSITVPESVSYFRLDDVLPAGLEILIPSLQTNQGRLMELMPQKDIDEKFWFVGGFNWVALQDTGVSLYAETLERGTYVFTYQVQAITPGTFQLLPTSGSAMYEPDVFGRTAGGTFVIASGEADAAVQP